MPSYWYAGNRNGSRAGYDAFPPRVTEIHYRLPLDYRPECHTQHSSPVRSLFHHTPLGLMADRHLNIAPKKIKTYPPPPSTRAKCPDPLATFTAQQLTVLDPRSSRTRLFSKTNPDAAKLGDILLVRFKSGDPFAGVCMNIRRRGVDTSILLRAQLTRIGTEMWVKVYSPTVVGIEVVQRAEKRARRARLYHLRKPKHDRGSLQGIVDAYIRQRSLLGRSNVGSSKGRGANTDKKMSK